MFAKRDRRGRQERRTTVPASVDDDDEGVAIGIAEAGAAARKKGRRDQADDVESARSTFTLNQEHQSQRNAVSVSAAGYSATVQLDDPEPDRPATLAEMDALEAAESLDRPTLYKGQHKEKNPFGPMKAPANIRVITRIDYQPDICKDYKETGYCGYGDSCKFLHDRGDYKAGWQIDKDWDKEQAQKAALGSNAVRESYEISDEDEDADELPFACAICRKPFDQPVVTRCGHYFCQRCALSRFSKSSKCATCNSQTMGIFNTAVILIKRIEQRNLKDSSEVEEKPVDTEK